MISVVKQDMIEDLLGHLSSMHKSMYVFMNVCLFIYGMRVRMYVQGEVRSMSQKRARLA